MNVEELAALARVERDVLESWVLLGLLAPDEDGSFGDDAPERARLVRLAVNRGIPADRIAEANQRQGDVLGRFVDQIGPDAGTAATVEEAADRVGLDLGLARQLARAAGLDPAELRRDDEAALAAAKTALDAGLPPDALLQLMRVYSDALGRVADAEARLFHFHVHDRLHAEGGGDADPGGATSAAAATLLALVEPTVRYFHHKALTRAMREDVLVHLAEEVAPAGAIGELPVAVLFVDLVGFTPLTDAMGDEAAAGVLDRFSDLVRDEASHCDGRVVKQIGDEFMLVFPDPRTAVSYALHLADDAAAETDFPTMRIGVHAGSALYREADYLGATVNIAARVVSEAAPGQLVVTDVVRRQAEDLAERWEVLGPRQLKGLHDPVELHATALAATPFAIDPICGMTVDPGRAIHGSSGEQFCSETCRDRFEAADRR
jgi:class 3 adenylate cyclase/YHS domain-containing protein